MAINTDIIVEIGYNHLGSRYLLKKLIENTIQNKVDITFQIRSTEVEEILQIDLNYILELIKFYKNKYLNNFKVGFAIDSLEYFDKISEISDFLKLLSVFPNKEEFLGRTNYIKPIFVSLGLDSIDKIKLISKAARDNNIKFNSIFTTFDSSGNDVSIKELKNIQKFSDSISFGYHQQNILLLPTITSLVNFNKIFIYLNPGFNEESIIFLPDSRHSVKIDKILQIKETLKWKNKSINNKPRGSFKNFTND